MNADALTRWFGFAGAAARWALAAVFLAASLPKIAQPDAFALAVFRYQLLPAPLVNLAALALPWVELAAAVALVVGRAYRRAALVILVGLLAVFTAAIAFNLWRGLDIACGCFSVEATARPITWWNLARNAGLILLGLLAWRPTAAPR